MSESIEIKNVVIQIDDIEEPKTEYSILQTSRVRWTITRGETSTTGTTAVTCSLTQ